MKEDDPRREPLEWFFSYITFDLSKLGHRHLPFKHKVGELHEQIRRIRLTADPIMLLRNARLREEVLASLNEAYSQVKYGCQEDQEIYKGVERYFQPFPIGQPERAGQYAHPWREETLSKENLLRAQSSLKYLFVLNFTRKKELADSVEATPSPAQDVCPYPHRASVREEECMDNEFLGSIPAPSMSFRPSLSVVHGKGMFSLEPDPVDEPDHKQLVLWATIRLAALLDGLSPDDIGTCEHKPCGKYFLMGGRGKWPKRFCSDRGGCGDASRSARYRKKLKTSCHGRP